MGNKIPHLTLITLNWNGWEDTIECLESLLRSTYENFDIVLIDNNSTDDSLAKIKEWLNGKSKNELKTNFPEYVYPLIGKPLPFIELELKGGELQPFETKQLPQIILMKSDANLGFAAANNIGIWLATNLFNSKYVFLLNNDTVIPPDALQNTVNILEQNDRIGVVQAAQYYYDDKTKLAHAGGYVKFWGQYRYYRTIRDGEIKPVTFVSGCALCIRADVLKKYGTLSEKFFFGEEDFEFSLRMNKNQINMVCPSDCRVYHKIAVASKKMLKNYPRSVMLYSLNRIINMKDFYPKPIWRIWRVIAMLYFTMLLIVHYKVPLLKSIKTIYIVGRYSLKIYDMKKSTVEKIFKEFEERLK